MTNSTIVVVDAAGANQTIAKVPDLGRAAANLSLPVAWATEDQTVMAAMNTAIATMNTSLTAIGANTPASGRAAAASSKSVTWATEDQTAITTMNAALVAMNTNIPVKGRVAAANSLPVVYSTEDQTLFTAMNTSLSTTVASLAAMNTTLIAINANTPVAYAAGAGAVGATVQRVTFASDAPILATSTGDGNSVTIGALADAAVAAGANGSISAKLRTISRDIVANIVIAAGENVIGKTVGVITNPTANFTRPADTAAYAVGDLVANSTTAGSVTALTYTAAARVAAGSAQIRRVRVSKTTTTTTSASFRVHFFSATPLAPTNGDNGAFIPAGASTYLGSMDVLSMIATTDGAVGIAVMTAGSEINFALASGQTIFALLEARAAYAPGNAEVFTVVPEIIQN